jgi:hypothetical protein
MESRKFRCAVFSTVALIFTLVFSLRPAGAQSGDGSFKGQTITVIAGSSAGGGTDSLARLLAAHFGKHIPGNPRIIVTNIGGAAGLIAANQLYNRSPKDGTVIGTMATGLTFRTALHDPAIKFQLEKFTYLGQIASEGNFVYVRSETPFTSIEAIKKANKEGKKPKFGAQAKEHNSNVVPKAMEAILGIDVDVVYGYPGTAEILLDLERGALDGRAQSRGSLFSPGAIGWKRILSRFYASVLPSAIRACRTCRLSNKFLLPIKSPCWRPCTRCKAGRSPCRRGFLPNELKSCVTLLRRCSRTRNSKVTLINWAGTTSSSAASS